MQTNQLIDAYAGKTDRELFLAAFQGNYDDDAPWEAVDELRKRDTPEVFQLAVGYSHSNVPLERARALDVLGQLGAGMRKSVRTYLDQSVGIAEDRLYDDDPIVVHSAAWALSHLQNERAISALIQVRDNANPGVRWAVACGVVGSGSVDAIQTLIRLMDDTNETVRDWATFGLGAQRDEDSAEIRDALRKRLNDTFEDARNEAIWGLARRKDQIGLKSLLQRLDTDHWSCDEMTAAEILGVCSETPVENLRAGLQSLQYVDRPRGQ